MGGRPRPRRRAHRALSAGSAPRHWAVECASGDRRDADHGRTDSGNRERGTGTRDWGLGTRPGTFYCHGGILGPKSIPAESPVPVRHCSRSGLRTPGRSIGFPPVSAHPKNRVRLVPPAVATGHGFPHSVRESARDLRSAPLTRVRYRAHAPGSCDEHRRRDVGTRPGPATCWCSSLRRTLESQ